MAKAFLKTAGAGGVGFLIALAIGEAGTPGTAKATANSTTGAVLPVIEATGTVGGETMRAGGTLIGAGVDSLNQTGVFVPNQTVATEDTLPTTPLEET